jgi:hypothetical protein
MPEVQDPKDERDLTFYYDHDHRMRRASPELKAYYAKYRSGYKRGVFSFLKENRSLTILLVVAFVLCMIYLAADFYDHLGDGSVRLGPYSALASARVEGESAVLDLRLERRGFSRIPQAPILRLRTSFDGLIYTERSVALKGQDTERLEFLIRLPAGDVPAALDCLLSLGAREAHLVAPIKAGASPEP